MLIRACMDLNAKVVFDLLGSEVYPNTVLLSDVLPDIHGVGRGHGSDTVVV